MGQYLLIHINTIFSGMNIHLPAILGFTRYQGFDPSPYGTTSPCLLMKSGNRLIFCRICLCLLVNSKNPFPHVLQKKNLWKWVSYIPGYPYGYPMNIPCFPGKCPIFSVKFHQFPEQIAPSFTTSPLCRERAEAGPSRFPKS